MGVDFVKHSDIYTGPVDVVPSLTRPGPMITLVFFVSTYM